MIRFTENKPRPMCLFRRIALSKQEIFDDIDRRTWKRVDASMVDAHDRTQNAVASDSEENTDFELLHRLAEYRDAKLRRILQAYMADRRGVPCPKPEDMGVEDLIVHGLAHAFYAGCHCPDEFPGEEIDNAPKLDDLAFIFDFGVEPGVGKDDLVSLSTMMHEYIVRGAVIDWYDNMMLQVPTMMAQSLQDLEDDMKHLLFGKAYNKSPLQPFGPKRY